MRRYFILTVLALLVVVSCSNERGIEPLENSSSLNLDPEYLASEIVAQTGWPDADGLLRTPEGCGNIIDIEREEIVPGIAHYSYMLRIGEGDYDFIKLHRVVKEKRPYRPIATCKSVFCQHGDGVGFEGVFLYGSVAPSVSDDHAIAVYLAQSDVDVWGIDQNWILVPVEVTDFSFMADWGMQNQIENLDIALSIARFTRLLTGGGPGKMHLMGYSSGVWTGYSYLNMETQKPECMKNVNGFIPVDGAFKTDFEPTQTIMCTYAMDYQAMFDGGQYADPIPFAPVGYLAMTDPEGDSPIAPGYTNYQVAMLFGSTTHIFSPIVPWYHFIAGEFDEYGMPTGMQFITDQAWFEFMMTGCAWEPVLFELNYMQTTCDAEDVPWDDYLADVTIPVFNVGASGALGNISDYTLTLLGSCDVTSLVVELYSPEEIYLDFGHIDLFVADNAPSLVWMPVLDWINDHSCRNGKKDVSMTQD